jgi:hypothetical protein
MIKTCVFCGEKPSDKNKEHILPRWLLKMTGDPNRVGRYGIDWKTGKERKFSASHFVFPACEKCNSRYGELENQAAPLITRLVNRENLKAEDFKRIFDWLDKIRTGLWLGYRYLNKNNWGINPHFHINQRIGQKDRILLCYPHNEDENGLSILGPQSPLFDLMPSTLVLRINGIILINISSDFIISSRIGFPYPTISCISNIKNQKSSLTDMKIRSKIVTPIFPFKFHKPSIYIAQMKTSRDRYMPFQQIYQKSSYFHHFYISGNDIYDDDIGSNIFDNLSKNNFCYDDEVIRFRLIPNNEAVTSGEIFFQLFDAQEYILKCSFFGNEISKSTLQLHRALKKAAREEMIGQTKK